MSHKALLLAVVFAAILVAKIHSGEPPATKENEPVALEVARDRAKTMHGVFADTLDVLHHHYFRREASVLPARAIDDIFARIENRTNTKVRWIAVNTPAMNVDHVAKSDFEKQAVKELAAGKAEFTRIEKGQYLRATPIALGEGCVRCHTKFTQGPVKPPLFAGLVVAIPITDKE